MELKDKVAIVTGASHGIGRVIAERIGKEGAAVVVNYAGSEGAAALTVQSIKSAGGEALAVQADVSDADENDATSISGADQKLDSLYTYILLTHCQTNLTTEAEAKNYPINRLAMVEEMARVVMWLSSDDATIMVGTDIDATGGYLTK